MVASAAVAWSLAPEPSPVADVVASRRVSRAPRLGAALESIALAHSRFRLDVVRHRNVVCDERLFAHAFERRGRVDRPHLIVVLEGRARLDRPEGAQWLEPGGLALLPDRRACLVRREGSRFTSLALEWDPGTLGGAVADPRRGRLTGGELARLRATVEDLADTPLVHDGATRLAAMLALLRTAGVPLEAHRAPQLAEPTPVHVALLSRALDQLLSDLATQPMVVDLEQALGVSPRHLQRLVAAYHERYGFDADGWRDALHRRRLQVAAALMTAPSARADLVASTVGYGSPAALCRAFAEVQLPSPTGVRAAVLGATRDEIRVRRARRFTGRAAERSS